MNWGDIFNTLEQFLPLLSTLTGHPELGVLAQKLIAIGEDEIARRMNQTGKTRAEILADAAATYAQLKVENDALRRAGHEGDV